MRKHPRPKIHRRRRLKPEQRAAINPDLHIFEVLYKYALMKREIWLGLLFAACTFGCVTDNPDSTSTSNSNAPGLKIVVEQDLKALEYWVLRHRLDTGKLPATLKSLMTNDGVEKWRGPYISNSNALVDLWGNDYVIESGGAGFALKSGGPDGQLGTEDDISLESR